MAAVAFFRENRPNTAFEELVAFGGAQGGAGQQNGG